MTESLNVVALISGGKDSFFSILHCLYHNHNVIALANLFPPGQDPNSDLNSHMYQTVGHNLIPKYQEALGLPLYRGPILGTAVNANKDYEPPSSSGVQREDEAESLLHLLRKVKRKHPEVNAVCSGAISSVYQRTRVESVATRLDLVSLSYLWQYHTLPTPVPNDRGLLDDIAAVGLDARILKVSGGSLDENILWLSLKDRGSRDKIVKNLKKFGDDVLGEGGDYETLVMDGPSGVWNMRLEVDESERTIIHEEGGAKFMALASGALIDKEVQLGDADSWKQDMNIPQIWDAPFNKLVEMKDEVINIATYKPIKPFLPTSLLQNWAPTSQMIRLLPFQVLNNLKAIPPNENYGLSTENQMHVIRASLLHYLEKYQRRIEEIVFVIIVLRSMADFGAVNKIYTMLFDRPNPPARVTVACGDGLPQGNNVMIHMRLAEAPFDRLRPLHIQSRSYWAPANIGPYSQAVAVSLQGQTKECSMVYIAGQIPLVPHSMQVYGGITQADIDIDLATFWEQTCLALQHLWRISRSMKVIWWAYGIAYFVAPARDKIRSQAMLTSLAWKCLHERLSSQTQDQEDDKNVSWERTYGSQRRHAVAKEETSLPDFASLRAVDGSRPESFLDCELPAFFAVQVVELPRKCPVEWSSLGLTATEVVSTTYTHEGIVYHNCCALEPGRFILTASIPLRKTRESFQQVVDRVIGSMARLPLAIIFTTRGITTTHQVIPCLSIWNIDGIPLSAAIIMECDSPDDVEPARG